jgi:prepilin signal peptidase PulO-like enzyme (type II secretory pathway)
MVFRYLKVFKKNIFLIIVIITLIIVSSVTKGKTATITSTLAGIAMIYGGITFIMWIIRTPTKKEKDEPL